MTILFFLIKELKKMTKQFVNDLKRFEKDKEFWWTLRKRLLNLLHFFEENKAVLIQNNWNPPIWQLAQFLMSNFNVSF